MGILFAGKESTGRLYRKPKAMLSLGNWYFDGFVFVLPAWISLRPRRQIVVTQVQGLEDTVKEIMDLQGYEVDIQGEIGNWEVRTIFRSSIFMILHGPIKGTNDIRDLLAMFRDKKKPLEAVDEEGILAAAGISNLVIHDISIEPIREKPHAFSISLGCYSELNPDVSIVDLMPEEGLF